MRTEQTAPPRSSGSWPWVLTILTLALTCPLAVVSCVSGPSEQQTRTALDQASEAVAESIQPPLCPAVLPAERPLPGVAPEHETLDYWLERVEATQGDLDETLLDPSEISDHNSALLALQSERPLGLYELLAPVDRAALQQSIDERLAWLRDKFDEAEYVERDGQPLSAAELAQFEAVALPEALRPELRVALEPVPVRCGPRVESYYTPSLDLRFDRNNCSTAHPQEIIQVLHRWPNGLLLARTRYTIGWIAPDAPLSPAFSGDEIAPLVHGDVQILEPLSLTADDGTAAALPRGTRLASGSRADRVRFATSSGLHESGGLAAGSWRSTARPLTRRAVLEEAFAYLGTPYGWGGEGAGRDCSRFLLDIFESFGLDFPRHSAYQADAGVFSMDVSELENETERALLIDSAARRGIVLLHFPGHIMLYLGRNDDGQPMAIHAFAEYLAPCPEGTRPEGEQPETLFTVDRISVSNLELGRGTSRTSFIERITRIVVLGPSAEVELAGVAEVRPAAPPVAIPSSGECRDSQEIAIFTTPLNANSDEPLRVIAVSQLDLGPIALHLVDPRDRVLTPETRRFGGPPYGWIAQVDAPDAGGWRALLADGQRVEACWNFRVRSHPLPVRTAPDWLAEQGRPGGHGQATAAMAHPASPRPHEREPVVDEVVPDDAMDGVSPDDFGPDEPVGPSLGPVWELRRTWGPATENLYSVWVESLFDYPPEDDLTWTSLSELLQDQDRNFLYNFLGQNEDELLDEDDDLILFLQPDCADLPYLLRAYYTWKMGLPYGFRRCARGSAGQPPGCLEVNTNLIDRQFENDVEAFAHFANRDVRRAVHSASGRTHPEYEFSDYYPVALTREALTPGTVFADPYGHLLVIVEWVPQGLDSYGLLIGADAQPDGTVGRRRFWRGSFLFHPDTTDVGAGFKHYRPLYYTAELDPPQVIAMTNELLGQTQRFAQLSLQQYQGTADDFYETMEALINPRPLDPVAMQLSLVDALEEAVSRRLTSVDNGEQYMRSRGYRTIEMPEGYAIFETVGAWEDYSTPSRDMRLLISIDTVIGFPDVVRRAPERFGILPDEIEAGVARVEDALDEALRSRRFSYTRSDGSPRELSLYDVVERRPAFEMAYNPNDCVEIRWAAPPDSDEYGTCDRHTPSDQLELMRSYRPWFTERRRPPR